MKFIHIKSLTKWWETRESKPIEIKETVHYKKEVEWNLKIASWELRLRLKAAMNEGEVKLLYGQVINECWRRYTQCPWTQRLFLLCRRTPPFLAPLPILDWHLDRSIPHTDASRHFLHALQKQRIDNWLTEYSFSHVTYYIILNERNA